MLGILLAPASPAPQTAPGTLSIKANIANAQATQPSFFYFQLTITNPDSKQSVEQSKGYNTIQECNADISNLESQAVVAYNTLNGTNYSASDFNFQVSTPCHSVVGPQSTQASNVTQQSLSAYLRTCGVVKGSVIGCFLQIMYFFLVTIPSWLLAITARLFNYLAALTLSDTMYRADFIGKMWTIVRDFANIFFILILLYAAFSVILGLGHGGGKKIVASVILIALLVNFSLFLSKIVIDSSNILALIFYNKIECIQANGTACPPDSTSNPNALGVQEKNLSGALVSTFNINKFYNADFFKNLENSPENWRNASRIGTQFETGSNGTLDDALSFALMVTYAFVIYPLAWIFFIVGISFLGRMIELILLMVISPLAFVTASVPGMKNINTIGFGSWTKKLFETSFVAAIFMAILYLVAQMMNANIFSNTSLNDTNLDITQRLLLIFIPALLIIVTLKKGSEYAKKASGEFTGFIMSSMKVLGGLALGGVALGAAGAASVGRQTAGAAAKYIQNDSARSKDSFRKFGDYKSWSLGKKLNPLAYAKQVGKGVSSGIASGVHKVPTGGGKTLGQRMQTSDRGYSEKIHSLATLNDKAKSEFAHTHGNEVKYKDLTETEQKIVKKEVDKDEMAKFIYGKKFKDLEADASSDIQQRYNNGERAQADKTGHTVRIDLMNTLNKRRNNADQLIDNNGNVINRRNPGWENSMVEDNDRKEKTRSEAIAEFAKLETPIGEFVQALRKGSYDIRDVSKAPSLVKVPLGIAGGAAALFGAPLVGGGMLAGLAGGIREGLKKGAKEYGNVNKDVFKDLGDVVAGALKNIKIKVDTGGDKGHDHGGEVKSVGH
jgi:hypothetical protein